MKEFVQSEVTKLVLEYKETGDPRLYQEIRRRTKRLVWGVIRSYGMMDYPPLILEDVEDECRGYVLMITIDKYDVERKANFETLYTWWCRSYTRAKKGCYQRRANLVFTPSVDQAMAKNTDIQETAENSQDYFAKRDLRIFSDARKEIATIFGMN